MGEETKIQWCDHTFNPWVGCSKVSPGCANCYAEADMDKRRHFAKWGPNGTRIVTVEANWKRPLKWDRDAKKAGVKRVVFCASLADVFERWRGKLTNSKDEQLYHCYLCRRIYPECITCTGCGIVTKPHEAHLSHARANLFRLIDSTPNLIWRILTKRPENILKMWPSMRFNSLFRKNVQLYTSVENQEQADKRIPELLKCHELVSVLGISAEPLLEKVSLFEWLGPDKINHVIVGGESGPDARPFCSMWAGALVIQCFNARVPFFMKQFGSNPYHMIRGDKTEPLSFNDSKGGDPDEWDEVFRIRELPEHSAQ